MSQTIDSKVVEMRFDNSNFEANVSQSISTLDRLKASLNLGGAAKGLQEVQNAAKSINLNPLSSAVITVQNQFSALDAIAFSALQRITNQAMQAGEQLMKSLTIDNISAGWGKFAEKTQSVATLIAQGYDIDTVNDQLNRLNWFTDETSYNFTDMVSNISKFTAAGQDLEGSVTAMEGIANWAALSGQNAATASRAMYQLSQAMGAGKMRYEDFKSIQNASMDTQEFRQHCLDAAVALGTLEKTGENTYKALGAKSQEFDINSFTSQLTKDEWLTSDVMMKVFNEYSAAVGQIYDYAEEHGITASEAIEALGGTVDDFGLKAFLAAQEARTFGDVIDSLKDAAGTGWMNIFESIFGDYTQSRQLWTGMANQLYDVFAEPINGLGEFVEEAFGDSFETLDMDDITKLDFDDTTWSAFQKVLAETAEAHGVALDKMIEENGSFEASLSEGWLTGGIFQEAIDKITGEDFANKVNKSTEELQELRDVATAVIRGDYGNGQERIDRLTEAGFNAAEVQNYVNIIHELTNGTWDLTDAIFEQADARVGNAETLVQMSDAELATLGYTEDEIKALRELAKTAKETGTPLNELLDQMEQKTGRELFAETILGAITRVQNAINFLKGSWRAVFDAPSSKGLYNAIKGLHDFVVNGRLSDRVLHNIRTSLKGLFSVLGIAKEAVGALTRAFGPVLLNALSSAADGFLRVTNAVGRFFMDAYDYVKDTGLFDSVFQPLANVLSKIFDVLGKIGGIGVSVIEGVFKRLRSSLKDSDSTLGKFINKIKDSKAFQTFSKTIGEAYENFNKFLDGVDVDKLVDDIFNAFDKAGDSISKFIDSVKEFGPLEKLGNVLETIKDKVKGFWDSIKSIGDGGEINIGETFKNLGTKIRDAFIEGLFGTTVYADSIEGSIEDGIETSLDGVSDSIETGGLGAGIQKLADNLWGSLVTWFKNPGKATMEGFEGVIQTIAKIFTGQELDDPTSVKNILLTAGGFVSLVKIFKGLGGTVKSVMEMPKTIKSFISNLSLLGRAMAKDLEASALLSKAKALALAISAIVGAIAILGNLEPAAYEQGKDAMYHIASMLMVMFTVKKLIEKLLGGSGGGDGNNPIAGPLETLAKGLSKAAKRFATLGGIGIMFAGVGAGVLMIASAIEKLNKINWKESSTGVTALIFIVGGLAAVCALIGASTKTSSMTGAAATILALTLAINALMIPIGILSMMSWGKLIKGAGSLAVLIAALGYAVSKMAGNSSLKSAAEIIALALALDMLVPPIVILGNMKGGSLLKGGLAVAGILIALGAAINVIGEGVKDKAVATILTMTLALGAMTAMTKILGGMDAGSLIKGVGAIGILLWSLSRSLARVGKNSKDIKKGPIITMTVCVAALGVLVHALGSMKLGNAIQGVAAVEILLWSLAGALKLLSGSEFDASAIIGIVVMTTAVFALTNMVMMLSDLPVEKALASTLGLSALMLSLAGAFKIFSTIPPIATLFGMLGLVASLYTLFFSLAGMGALINKFPAIGEAFDTLGTAIGSFIGSIGAGITNKMPQIGTDLSTFATNITPFLENADKIGTAMGSLGTLAGAFADFAGADFMGAIVSKLTGENSIDKFLELMDPLAEKLATFGNKISKAEFNEDKIAAAEGIGKFAAALYKELPNVGGWSGTVWGDPDFTGFVGQLAPLGEGLADYAKAIEGAEFGKNIKKSEELGEFIAALYSQKIPKKGGLSSIIDGIPQIDEFLTKIPELAGKLSEYALIVNTFHDEFGSDAITKSEELATFIAGLFKNEIPTEPTGFMAFVTGQKPMIDDFVANIGPLGEGLAEYAKVLNGQKFDDTAITKSEGLAEFIGKLFSSENFPTIDTSTGFFGFVQSKPDISGFVDNIKPLATELAKYAFIVNAFGDLFGTEAITQSEKLAEFYASLNKDYGLNEIVETSILGFSKKNGIGAFGDGLTDLATGLGNYVNSINSAGLNVGNLLVAQMATTALADLARSLNDVKLGGWFSDGTLSGFGGELKTFGENLKLYYESVMDFDKGKLTAVTDFLSTMGDLIPMMESFTSVNEDTGQIGTLNLSGFGAAIAQLSEPITKFVEDIGKETEEIKTASKGFVEAFVEGMEIPEGTDLSNSATTIIENLQKSLEDADLSTAATTMMEGLTSSITDKSSEVQTAGETIAKELKSGLESNKTEIGNVYRDPLAHALEAVRDKVSSFNSAGVSIATNLYNGMRSLNGSMGSAYSSPLSTALSNVQGYAKSFFSAGYNIGAQLAAGIRSMVSQVRSAVDQLIAQANRASSVSVPSGGGGGASGKSGLLGSGGPAEALQVLSSELPKITLDATKAVMKADSTLNSTLKNISDAIEDKMEIEPKVKPVLDMSSVNVGVNQMQKLFSFQPGPGVLGNLGAIDAAMRGDGQNEASTTDVIDAINALRDAILDATGDTYNVNGVTYDDGTNVSSAIKQLVDAIIMERRA